MLEFIKKFFSKKNILNNIRLKIVSLVLAFGVWIMVVSITDPIGTETYRNIPVKLVNTSIITDNGQTLEILDKTDSIATVTIRASRNTIRELGTSADSIVAIADFSKLSADKTSVPIDISTSKYNDKIDRVRASSDKLSVKIENRKSVQLPIQTITSGDIESGYILGNTYLSQNQVRVSGPESVIERIKTAKIDIQVSGFTEDITTQADIVFYDEDGKAIAKDNLTSNADSVKATVEILNTKRVPVRYDVFGTPAEGYAMTGETECTPDSVVIAGASSVIANINGITIPSTELNITGQSSNFIAMVDLQKFLADGIRFADSSFNGKASVKVYIEKLIEDNFGIDNQSIEIKNIPAGMTAEVEDGEIYEFATRGLAQDLERISLDSLEYYVDFDDLMEKGESSKLKEGTYELKLYIGLPDNISLVNELFIKVKLSE